jgi:hypothetical protein
MTKQSLGAGVRTRSAISLCRRGIGQTTPAFVAKRPPCVEHRERYVTSRRGDLDLGQSRGVLEREHGR